MMRFLLIVAAAAGVALAMPGPVQTPQRAPELTTILDEHVEFLKRSSPVTASTRGDLRFNDRLPDESPTAYRARRDEVAARLDQLRRLDRACWAEDDHLDADLLDYDLSRQLAGARFAPEQKPIDTMSGPQIWLPQMWMSLPFQNAQHYADYTARLEAIPALIEQHIEQMRLGLEAGRVPPRIVMHAAVEQCLVQAKGEIERDPTLSAFYRPFIPRGEDDAAARARRAISEGIVPAFRRLAAFLEEEYIPRCRPSIAISDGVDGIAAYDHALSVHTTLPLTAAQVHEIGMREVARIRGDMLITIARSDFAARRGEDSPRPSDEALIDAFLAYLRTDPRFYYDTAEGLLAGYREIAKRIDPHMPGLFATLPRNTYGVREIPRFAAVSSPTAYYYRGSLRAGLPGYFMANTHRLDQRPKYSMIALTLHEAVPGHHLQIALADELEGHHEYRQWVGFTAFSEGWGLYAERLGLEMGPPPHGIYADPYDDFGRLSFEMWRACRLVVDTGMHAKGWSRDRAIEFMLANTALARFDIEREVDRYIGWPGQATAYKIGELKIRELRARAEEALGGRFDVRAFHDAVLLAGAIPLEVLEARINRWIEARR
jgi:uncharacterized protein (DUF885 family)